MKSSRFKYISFFLSLVLSNHLNAQLIIPYYNDPPLIDGEINIIDPWRNSYISQDSINESSSTFNMHSRFQTAYSFDDKIALLIEVIDSTPNNDSEDIPDSGSRDCIELFFSMKSTELDIGDYGEGDHYIRIQRASDDNNYIDGSESVDIMLDNGAIDFAINNTANGYFIEIAIDLMYLAGESDFDGNNFSFDIATIDNTTGTADGATQKNYWYSKSDEQQYNTIVLGPVELQFVEYTSQSSPIVFIINDAHGNPIENATVFVNEIKIQASDSNGLTRITVSDYTNNNYVISKNGYKNIDGEIYVWDARVFVNATLIEEENNIPTNSIDETLKIFPNPASKILTIQRTKGFNELSIINMHGQEVYTLCTGEQNTPLLSIDISHLVKGVYFVKTDAFIERFIIE